MSDSSRGSEEAPSKDFLLRSLVQLVNTTPVAVGLTLSVRGVLVTGIAAGWQEYFEYCVGQFQTDASQTSAPESKGLALLFDVIRDWQTEREQDKPDIVKDPHFIHLRDARYLVGGQLVPAGGSWWRGRISEVDGFNIGIIEVSS